MATPSGMLCSPIASASGSPCGHGPGQLRRHVTLSDHVETTSGAVAACVVLRAGGSGLRVWMWVRESRVLGGTTRTSLMPLREAVGVCMCAGWWGKYELDAVERGEEHRDSLREIVQRHTDR